ncbi:MAG TPA: sulfotransferase family 2 domain-containing protein [Terriglobales bacterium]|nr:sulfotransferase family 2 domain-containing protein [Terriglobales bacterium]
MPSFYHRRRNYLITTSLKVMYSSLAQQPELEPLHDAEAWTRYWLTPGVERFCLVRDPYDRLVSFYTDKLRTAPKTARKAGWQHCQRIFFADLALAEEMPDDQIAERLRAVTFEEFLALLPRLYRKDPHLWPQARSLTYRAGPLPLPAPSGTILKMEAAAEVCERLALDPTIHVNRTEHDDPHALFRSAGYAIANRIYRNDFKRYGYALRTAPEDPL